MTYSAGGRDSPPSQGVPAPPAVLAVVWGGICPGEDGAALAAALGALGTVLRGLSSIRSPGSDSSSHMALASQLADVCAWALPRSLQTKAPPWSRGTMTSQSSVGLTGHPGRRPLEMTWLCHVNSQGGTEKLSIFPEATR